MSITARHGEVKKVDVMQYAELFQAEAGEYMQVLNQCLLNLERDPKDREELHEAFRVVHSLKGMAGTMGYQHVTDIAHGLENFMEDYKTGEQDPSPEVLDLVFEAVDLLQLSLENPEKSTAADREKWDGLLQKMKGVRAFERGENIVAADEQIEIGELVALGAMEEEILRQAADKGRYPCLARVSLRKDTMMKAVRVYMIFKALEEHAEIVASYPDRQDLEEEQFDRAFDIIAVFDQIETDRARDQLARISDVEEVIIEPWKKDDQSMADKEAEPVPDPQEIEEPEQQAPKTASPAEETGQVSRTADKMVRVETQKLDDLVNLVGEMVVARNRITEIGRGFNEDLDSTIDQLKLSITNLQDTAIGLRMVPIKQVFERFPRMVRDLCRERGKKVQLNISGEETELDRSIINRLSDPLVHLLRNAFDHGIESPEERRQKGKNPEGSIYLQAQHEGNQVVITVEDDGGGIDPQKVGKKALEKGIISEKELSQLNREDLVSLIFFNGFSTSAEITEVSGRGVGMDAVRNSIESLHGSVEVYSEIDVMTRFILRLPLTLAIIKVLLVKSSGQLYAIPVEIIRENVYLDRRDIRSIKGNPVVNLRGEVVPLYVLSGLLGFDRGDLPPGLCSVVIVEASNRKAGFVVEDLVGQQEIMIKSLGSLMKGLKGIAGATILGDGSVSLIIDVVGLLSEGGYNVEQNRSGS